MKVFIISAGLFFISFLSCSRRLCGCDPVGPPFIKAVVTETDNSDCRRPVIRIDLTDTAYVNSLTGMHGDMYVVDQLPGALKVSGQKIYINPGVLAAGEDFSCTAIGPTYPHLKVISAIARN